MAKGRNNKLRLRPSTSTDGCDFSQPETATPSPSVQEDPNRRRYSFLTYQRRTIPAVKIYTCIMLCVLSAAISPYLIHSGTHLLQHSRYNGANFLAPSTFWRKPWRILHFSGFLAFFRENFKPNQSKNLHLQILTQLERKECQKTCTLNVVESIPDNVTFPEDYDQSEKNNFLSTFDAWHRLFNLANKSIDIAAYKSSLRSKHVIDGFENSSRAFVGDLLFEQIVSLQKAKKIRIRMVENYPSKDKGDNEDGMSLERRGIIERRPLDYKRIFGRRGAMHSKFIIVDDTHFYLGSANFDWRSLNQKLEIGVLVENCPCLARDLKSIFDGYWTISEKHDQTDLQQWKLNQAAMLNHATPLILNVGGVPTSVHFATSPPAMNGQGRSWDLEAILSVINSAHKFVYINVMDYIPMFVYSNPKIYWPVIDDALRRAIIERSIELKITCSALHFVPENFYFLRSLLALNSITPKSSVEIKIFRVPPVTKLQTFVARDRRNHKKFIVTESAVIIGTSNWSGDYFDSSTGVQIVMRQNVTSLSEKSIINNNARNRTLIEKMRHMFLRDWHSQYAHSLLAYLDLCVMTSSIKMNQSSSTLQKHVCEPVRIQ